MSLVIMALLPFLSVSGAEVGKAATSQYGPVGKWSFCTSDLQIGCIDSIYFSTPDGRTSKAVSDADVTAVGATLAPSCSVSSMGINDQGQPYPSVSTNECDPTISVGTFKGCTKYAFAIFSISIFWPAGVGGNTLTVIRMGKFEPVHSHGAGTTFAETIKDTSGNYLYVWKAEMSLIHKLIPFTAGQLGGASVANATNAQAAIAIFPREYFTGSLYDMSYNPSMGTGDCGSIPVDGTWASSNAQSFSTTIKVGKHSSVPNFVNRFDFKAEGPHYKDPSTVNGSQTTLNDAYFRVYLSPVFLDSIGCTSDCPNIATATNITTEDGQVASPTYTKFGDGYLVNLGVNHFSAPNPAVKLASLGAPINATHNWKSQITGLPTVNYTPGAKTTSGITSSPYEKTTSVRKGGKLSLSSLLKPMSGYKATWKATGGCKIAGISMVMRKSAGTCVLTMTEKKGTKVLRTRKVLVKTK